MLNCKGEEKEQKNEGESPRWYKKWKWGGTRE